MRYIKGIFEYLDDMVLYAISNPGWLLKKLVILLVVVFFGSMAFGKAMALDFEASIGKMGKTHDMAYTLGLRGEVFGQYVHFGFADLGVYSITKMASVADWQDDIAECNANGGTNCNGPYFHPEPKSHKEIYLIAEHKVGKYGIELGAMAYYPYMAQDINAAGQQRLESTSIQISPVVGLSYNLGNYEIELRVQKLKMMGDTENRPMSDILPALLFRKQF